MTAPAGAHVKISVDTRMPIGGGDVIETQTGRRYLVETVRAQTRGRFAGIRQHLGVIVLEQGVVIKGATVIPIVWHRR